MSDWTRLRRLRSSAGLRNSLRETQWELSQLIAPLFVSLTGEVREEVPSMPGVYRLNVEEAVKEAHALHDLGIRNVLLFGIPAEKDVAGTGAYTDDGVVQQAIAAIKAAIPELFVIADVCLCEYMVHGHCGVLTDRGVDNDATLPLLAQTAVSQAAAGVDMVAPSAMMDHQVAAIRSALDEAGYQDVPIMSYAAKYASSFYGPFRDAADSAPQEGDRKAYQMDPANAEEAIREVELDIEEGADIVMVKPGTAYLDIVHSVKETFEWPTAVYHVSGEYSMLKAAVERGWLDEQATVNELLTSFRRAGADFMITYYAKQVGEWVKSGVLAGTKGVV